MVMHVKPIKFNKQQCGCVCDIDSSQTKKEHLILKYSLRSVLAERPNPGNANLENKNMAQMSQQSSQLAKDGLLLIIF